MLVHTVDCINEQKMYRRNTLARGNKLSNKHFHKMEFFLCLFQILTETLMKF